MTGTQPAPVLSVQDLHVSLGRTTRTRILHGVNLTVGAGEIVGLIGETGSGKTTIARTVLGLIEPEAGTIQVGDVTVTALRRRALREHRRSGRVQYVFQDPLRSLDPDFTVGDIVTEGLAIQGRTTPSDRRARAVEALESVGLDAGLAGRTPGQISGGQRQRVALARAIVMRPRLLLCDEPVSALDAANRNHVLRLLDRLRREHAVGIVVISHDLGSLAGIADHIVVLYRGRVVEEGPTADVLLRPRHPYTELLAASVPSIDRRATASREDRAELRERVAAAVG